MNHVLPAANRAAFRNVCDIPRLQMILPVAKKAEQRSCEDPVTRTNYSGDSRDGRPLGTATDGGDIAERKSLSTILPSYKVLLRAV